MEQRYTIKAREYFVSGRSLVYDALSDEGNHSLPIGAATTLMAYWKHTDHTGLLYPPESHVMCEYWLVPVGGQVLCENPNPDCDCPDHHCKDDGIIPENCPDCFPYPCCHQ